MTASSGRCRALAALGVSVLLAVGVSACGSNPAQTVTVLHDVHGALVRDVSGRTTPAHDGQRVQAGDDVRTLGDNGAATLATAGRRVLLGPGSTLTVLDGTHAELHQGSVLLLGRSGPPLSFAVGDFTVDAQDATVARLVRGYATTVGVYAGSARLAPSVGRGLVINALHQATVSGRAMPAAPAPLSLADDHWDQLAAPELVTYDTTIKQAAAGLGHTPTGNRVADIVPAAYVQGSAATGTSQLDSDAAIALVLARASTLDIPEAQRFRLVSQLRAEGGSWAVVADLVAAPSSRFGPALAKLITSVPPSPSPSPASTHSPGPTVLAEPTKPVEPAPLPTRRPAPRSTPVAPSPTTERTAPVKPSPAGPLAPLNPLVDELLSLLSLQPSPNATTSNSATSNSTTSNSTTSNAPTSSGLRLAPRVDSSTPEPLVPAVTGAVTGVVSGLLTAAR